MYRDIKSLTREELEAHFKAEGEPAYRVTQLLDWLYSRRATTWDGMTNLPKPLREKLREQFTLQTLELVRKQGSSDTTQKFLWKLADGQLIESVLIPANPALYGEASDRHTLCISTQVGCAYGCKFCASGLEGWKRNLEVNEIVEQVLAIERWHAAEVTAAPKTPPAEPTVPVAVELLVPPPTATVTVNGCAVEMVDAEGVTVIVVGLTPVPVRAMVCGDPVALSAMVTAAVSGPTAAGVKCP